MDYSLFWKCIREKVPLEADALRHHFPHLDVCSFAEADFSSSDWKALFGTKSRKRLHSLKREIRWAKETTIFTLRLLLEWLSPDMPDSVMDILVEMCDFLDLKYSNHKEISSIILAYNFGP